MTVPNLVSQLGSISGMLAGPDLAQRAASALGIAGTPAGDLIAGASPKSIGAGIASLSAGADLDEAVQRALGVTATEMPPQLYPQQPQMPQPQMPMAMPPQMPMGMAPQMGMPPQMPMGMPPQMPMGMPPQQMPSQMPMPPQQMPQSLNTGLGTLRPPQGPAMGPMTKGLV
jgi:hypothetical protein